MKQNQILATKEDLLLHYSTNRINQQRNASKYWEAMSLRKERGYGAMKISRIIDMPMSAIAYWLQGNKPRSVKAIEQLEHAKLLPLKVSDSAAFRLFSKALGLRYADGCIYEQKRNNSYTTYICFGNKIDALNFCKDVDDAWSIKTKPYFSSRAYYVYLPASIGRLMMDAGSPIGEKTTAVFNLPAWIFDLSKKLRWDFIDGLFSGDACTPRLQRGGTCCCSLRLSLSSEKSIANDFCKAFMLDIWKLLEGLGIKASRPKVMWNQPRYSKNGKITFPVVIRILTRKDNMIRFLENCPYTYRAKARERIKSIVPILKTSGRKCYA